MPGCRVHCWGVTRRPCAPGLECSRWDALPVQIVVEDGLTEDVPSSIVGYQKLRGNLFVVEGQGRFGKVAEW